MKKNDIWERCKELEEKIKKTYQEGVTLDEAEKLAAEFLAAQMEVGRILAALSLDAKMKKSGSKFIRGTVYLQHATKDEKKPSDTLLLARVDTDKLVGENQDLLNSADAVVEELSGYLSVFKDAHIYFRGLSRGRFE